MYRERPPPDAYALRACVRSERSEEMHVRSSSPRRRGSAPSSALGGRVSIAPPRAICCFSSYGNDVKPLAILDTFRYRGRPQTVTRPR